MRRLSVLTLFVVLIVAGCGGGNDGKSTTGSTAGPKPLPPCPLDALAGAKQPVEITYWHAMTRANEDELKRLTDAFNASRNDVHVTLSPSASYTDNFTRFKAGLATGALADLVQGADTTQQAMIDSGAVLPVASCITTDHASTSDLVPREVAYYTVGGVMYGMPFNNSNLVLYYDKNAFRKAGLDPAKPPTTLEQVKVDSRQIVDRHVAPYGIALKTDSTYFEHWLAKAGHTFVNSGNGRQARATAVTFDDPTGLSLFQWVDDMVTSKLMLNTGTSDLDHYLAVGNGRAAMTIDTSAALGTIAQLFSAGQYRGVALGVGPLPAPASPEGGDLVGGAANYIVNRSSPAKQAAAYQFAKYLASPQVQSEWAAATGYIPVSQSAVTLNPLAQKYAQQPEYKVAYDQLLSGAENAATAGAVVGAYGAKGEGIRGAVIDAISRMVDGSVSPERALHDAAVHANAAIEEYNGRIG